MRWLWVLGLGCIFLAVLNGRWGRAQNEELSVIPVTRPGPLVRPGFYRLDRDIRVKKHGLVIRSSDVILDLNGKSIIHRYHPGCRHNLLTVEARGDIEIRNGRFVGGRCGICLRATHGVIRIHHLTFERQRLSAIFAREGETDGKLFIEDNLISHAGFYGVILRRVDHATVRNNTIDSAGDYGIYVVYSHGGHIENNHIQVTNIGILVDNSKENHVEGNRIHYSYYSIYLFKSFRNIIRKNIMAFSNFGVFHYKSDDNLVKDNKRM